MLTETLKEKEEISLSLTKTLKERDQINHNLQETLKDNEKIKDKYRHLQNKYENLMVETENLRLILETYDDIQLPLSSSSKHADDPLIIKNNYDDDNDLPQYRGCLWRLGNIFQRKGKY